jgi:cytochrome c peroxidase
MICNYVTEKKWAHRLLAPVTALLLGAAVFCGPVGAQVVPVDPPAPALSLKDVEAPEPTNLYAFLKGNPNGTPEERDAAVMAKELAIVLGKALFWDMQVGSDDVQACASCHFNAGADFRTKNQLTPSNEIFGDSAIAGVPGPNDPPFNYGFGPNFDLTAEHFPFHRRVDPTGPVDPLVPADEFATVIMDTDDVVSSQGVRLNDSATDPDELTFNWKNANVRKVEPRNAPSMINAVFHMDMFWDGRASFVFNGVNPFGFRDREAKVLRNLGTAVTPNLQWVPVRIPLAGHASQSVGPPLSTLEMTGFIRNFPELAEKLLAPDLNPLALQMVHPDDSVLGLYAMAYYERNRAGRQTGKLINVPARKILLQATR